MSGFELSGDELSGYYDYHALVDLDRHLVLAGYISAESRQIGYQLAALTGLTANDLDRTVEHEAGKSVRELILLEGEERYRELERRMLQRLLTARPFGVLSLGDGALVDAQNRGLVLEASRFVLLDLDLANCFWRMTTHSKGSRRDWHPLLAGPLTSPEQVRPFFESRRPGFAAAHDRIDSRGKHHRQVVKELLAMIS